MTLKKLFDKAWAAAEQRSWVRALLGKPNGDGTYTMEVASRPGFVWVRVSTEGSQSLSYAKSIGKVALRANLPVRMRLENNVYVIYDVDSAYYGTATSGDATNAYGVQAHTHRRGTGLEYEVEAALLEPGRVYPATEISSFAVYINPFRYYASGRQYWPGGSLSLVGTLPVTPSTWAWVLVGIDPATNTPVAYLGNEENLSTDLTLDLLDDIDFGVNIPCGAIRVRSDATNVADYTQYVDARLWIDSGAVDNSRLAGMAEDTVKARFSSGTGQPEDVTLAALLAALAAGLTLNDISDVTITTPSDLQLLVYGAGFWSNVNLYNLLILNRENLVAPWVDWPLEDAVNATSFPEDVPYPGAGSYPLGWTEVNATRTDTDDPKGFWALTGSTGTGEWLYYMAGPYDIEADIPANDWQSYWIGPILLKDGLYPTDVDYLLALHANDTTGDPEAQEFVRLHIQWDSGGNQWRVRSEMKNGTTQTDGAWYALARGPVASFALRVAFQNNTNKTTRVYIGPNTFTRIQTLLGEVDLSPVVWGAAVYQFSMARTLGGIEPDDVILLGGLDYTDHA